MRYNNIDRFEVCNGKDIGVSLYLQGCGIRCDGCHSKKSWDRYGGATFTSETKEELFSTLTQPGVARLTITGGNPLEKYNWFDLACLIHKVKACFPRIKIWVYTGYTIEELLEMKKDSEDVNVFYLDFILNNIDILVDGPFIEELRDITLDFRGSSNQRILTKEEIKGKLK